jgi:hypothetical protein
VDVCIHTGVYGGQLHHHLARLSLVALTSVGFFRHQCRQIQSVESYENVRFMFSSCVLSTLVELRILLNETFARRSHWQDEPPYQEGERRRATNNNMMEIGLDRASQANKFERIFIDRRFFTAR